MFGHVRRFPEVTPAHIALHLAVKARTGHRLDNRPQWKRPRGRPRHPWMQQLEVDTGLAADVAWDCPMRHQRRVLCRLGTQPVIE